MCKISDLESWLHYKKPRPAIESLHKKIIYGSENGSSTYTPPSCHPPALREQSGVHDSRTPETSHIRQSVSNSNLTLNLAPRICRGLRSSPPRPAGLRGASWDQSRAGPRLTPRRGSKIVVWPRRFAARRWRWADRTGAACLHSLRTAGPGPGRTAAGTQGSGGKTTSMRARALKYVQEHAFIMFVKWQMSAPVGLWTMRLVKYLRLWRENCQIPLITVAHVRYGIKTNRRLFGDTVLFFKIAINLGHPPGETDTPWNAALEK